MNFNEGQKTIDSVKKFETAVSDIRSRISILEDTTSRVEGTFSPVITPLPPTPVNGAIDEAYPVRSGFDEFIADVGSRLAKITDRLSFMCDRSSI